MPVIEKKLSNWSNYPVVKARVWPFQYQSELQELVQQTASLIARGNGRCYGDASLGPDVISTMQYNHIYSFDEQEGIICCEAGVTLDDLLRVIVPKGWFLPVTPGTKFITVGGAVASDVHGKNHHKDGAFSRHVLEMDLVDAEGKVISCSPQKNTDLFWASCGGMGLTGVISRVTFRLKKIESSYIRQKSVKARNIDEIFRLFEESESYTYSVAWIDCLQKGKDLGRSVLMLGEHASLAALDSKKKKDPFYIPQGGKLSIPLNLPSFTLNSLSIQAFNFAYYHKQLSTQKEGLVHYEPFFYPLDSILHWNRMYGKPGFLQYQFVLPMEQSREGLVKILQRISDKKMGSFLAVLKLFGEQDSLISFPTRGYTLALDFPLRDGLLPFLDELDDIVLQYGGRIYLSKDARMKPELFWKGYPGAKKFQTIVKQYNPDAKFNSMQARRLHILP